MKGAKDAQCRMVTGSAVEDAMHYMGTPYMPQCLNDLYVQVFVFVFHYVRFLENQKCSKYSAQVGLSWYRSGC